MEITTEQQTSAFLWAFLLGAVFSVLYTVFVILRDRIVCSTIMIVISDMIFSFFLCAVNFLYAIAMTEGRVRLYVAAAQSFSFFLLYFSAGRVIRRKMQKIFTALSRIRMKMVNYICEITKLSQFMNRISDK